ncbi:hypothetical protein SAMN06265337_0932 [Hymenobacter gelipurpurascens]|uniref:Uncharacterized protein n=1 Tax=Hymenobacter gelipurpurascens TaxID=89968 RepID=A0A212TD10_9BACT|nr:hypothetical protein SAMN06265337_0932 [Hymenobacter gelipurpurascens]
MLVAEVAYSRRPFVMSATSMRPQPKLLLVLPMWRQPGSAQGQPEALVHKNALLLGSRAFTEKLTFRVFPEVGEVS